MSPDQIAALRGSFALVGDRRELVAHRFYEHLIGSDPAMVGRLPRDRVVHDGILAEALAVAVGALDDLDRLMEALGPAAAVHAQHHVRWAEYQAGLPALLSALRDVLRDDLTDEAAHAWGLAYNLLIEAMQQVGEAQAAAAGSTGGPAPARRVSGPAASG